MKRRAFLKKSVAASTVAVAMAGCSSGSSSQVNENIESARDTLLENEETFENVSDHFQSGDTPNFNPEQIRTRVDRAKETLGEVEGDASDEQAEVIDALLNWGDFQVRRAEGIELSIQLTSKWETVSTYLQTQQYEQAQTALDEADTIYDNFQTEFEEMVSAYENVDQDVLEEGGLEAYDEQMSNWFSQIRNWADGVEIYLNGFDPLLTGFVLYQDGTEEYQNEAYSEAVEVYQEAETEFAVAERELEALEEYSTDFPSIESDAVRLICTAGALSESSSLMAQSAREASQGNYESARDYANQAEQAASECSVGES